MKSKTVLYVGLVILLVAALASGLWLLRRQQALQSSAAPASTLMMTPSTATPQKDQTFTVNVTLDTGVNTVIAAELHMAFDKTKLSLEAVAPGTFFTTPTEQTKTIDNNAGTLIYTLYTPSEVTPKSGQDVIAILTFKALAAGPATISFQQPDTIIGGTGEGGQNVLVSATEASVTVQEAATGGGSPTPVPTNVPNAPTAVPTSIGTTTTPAVTVAPTQIPVTGGSGGSTGTGGSSGTGASSGTGGSTTTTTRTSTTATGTGSASGSGTSLPVTATPMQTALGIFAGVFLIVTSVFIKLRRVV